MRSFTWWIIKQKSLPNQKNKCTPLWSYVLLLNISFCIIKVLHLYWYDKAANCNSLCFILFVHFDYLKKYCKNIIIRLSMETVASENIVFIFHAYESGLFVKLCSFALFFLERKTEKQLLSLQRVSCYKKRGKKLLTVNKVFAKHISWFPWSSCKDIHHHTKYCHLE